MTALPDFEKDIEGQAYGGSYWQPAEYRVVITDVSAGRGEEFILAVQDSGGFVLLTEEFDGEIAQQISDLASTSEEQDDVGSLNITREIHWHLGDAVNHVDLGMNEIEEIADWFAYAFGDMVYEGPEDGWEW